MIPRITGVLRQIQKVTKLSPEIVKAQAHEMEYVPKYLELAMKGNVERFKPKEIEELTQVVKDYVTEGSKTDLVKELLAIGSKQGEMLSVDEMKNFMEMTSGFSEKGQKRVLAFMKHVKENIIRPKKTTYTRADVQNERPYEQFRETELRSKNTPFGKRCPEFYSEEQIQERYNTWVDRTLSMYHNPYHRAVLERANEGINPMQFIKRGNAAFVEGITTCDNPEKLADIVKELGNTLATAYCPNELVKIMELSGGNKRLLHTISENFYPQEIKQIVANLENTAVQKAKLTKFSGQKIGEYKSINSRRNAVIRSLGLSDKVSVSELHAKYMPAPKRLDGDCGRGKRNR